MLEKPNNRLNNKPNNLKKKEPNFSYIEELLDNAPMSYSFEDILNEKYGDQESFEKSELLREYNEYVEYEYEKGLIKQKYGSRDKWKEYNEYLNLKTKNASPLQRKELEIFNTSKLKMTLENIKRYKTYLLDKNYNYYWKYKENQAYWIGAWARYLSAKLLEESGRKTISKAIIEEYSKMFKLYYKSEPDNK